VKRGFKVMSMSIRRALVRRQGEPAESVCHAPTSADLNMRFLSMVRIARQDRRGANTASAIAE
jgi:hypothetical protein